jgi:heterodisulfide reductase subunit A-like polyferredoxin
MRELVNENPDMKLLVTYENTRTGEYEKYETTLVELLDSFNGTMNASLNIAELLVLGKVIFEVGHAKTTVKVSR